MQDCVQDRIAVLIAGPTASGKSALALAVAERIGGIVVNTDSMQVYRDLKIITARPGAAEAARASHLLYGHVDAAENYSVGRFLGDAAAALETARAQGRVPIFTGGSGLYFKALTGGLAAIPPVPPDVRAAVRARLDASGPAALHAELSHRDPVTAAGSTGSTAPPTASCAVLLAENVAAALDASLFSNVASSTSRPAGILNGVAPLTAATAGAGAMSTDLNALAQGDLDRHDRAGLRGPSAQAAAINLNRGLTFPNIEVWPTLGVAAGTVIALDPARVRFRLRSRAGDQREHGDLAAHGKHNAAADRERSSG